MIIKFKKESTPEFIERLYKRIDYAWCSDVYGGDYHSELFNRVYLYEDSSDAEKVLSEFKYFTIFKQISLIVEYEKSNFGETSTDISRADKVAEMLSYIFGEALLLAVDSKTLNDSWDNKLTEKDCKKVYGDIKKFVKNNPEWWENVENYI